MFELTVSLISGVLSILLGIVLIMFQDSFYFSVIDIIVFFFLVLGIKNFVTYFTKKGKDKDKSFILEEILNTNQTETIINIIKNYKDQHHDFINTTIYSINNETNTKFTSNAYYLENLLFKKILENKTFISTLNNLRLSGDIDDIEYWFDNITNKKNSYNNIINHLIKISQLQKKLDNKKFFKSLTINKIKNNISEILNIINLFNQNCNYK